MKKNDKENVQDILMAEAKERRDRVDDIISIRWPKREENEKKKGELPLSRVLDKLFHLGEWILSANVKSS